MHSTPVWWNTAVCRPCTYYILRPGWWIPPVTDPVFSHRYYLFIIFYSVTHTIMNTRRRSCRAVRLCIIFASRHTKARRLVTITVSFSSTHIKILCFLAIFPYEFPGRCCYIVRVFASPTRRFGRHKSRVT